MADIRVQLPLNGELIPGYRLKRLLNLVAEMENGEWTIIDETLGQDIVGGTQEEAIALYKKVLVDHYIKLERELQDLKQYIEKVE